MGEPQVPQKPCLIVLPLGTMRSYQLSVPVISVSASWHMKEEAWPVPEMR